MNLGKKPRVAIGQAGGPTAVINTSLIYFIEEAMKSYTVFGIINALQGLMENWIVEIDEEKFKELEPFRFAPGAILGSGRWSVQEDGLQLAVENLKKQEIHSLVLIGGNGTMKACQLMEETAAAMNYELQVIGIPKTVDNDLLVTDHTPGYGSAARYVASTVRDIGEDLKSMRNFENVRIVETMGRNVGWLTAASILLKESQEHPPHLIYVPETPFSIELFLQDVSKVVKDVGYALVVISEGIRDEQGQVLSQISLREGGKTVLGGASKYLADKVSGEMNLSVRAELLGMNQRCCAATVSKTDRYEAGLLGQEAVRLLDQGISGHMLTLIKDSEGDTYRVGKCSLSDVAGKERRMPESLLHEIEQGEGALFKKWLRSLVGDDLEAYPAWNSSQHFLKKGGN
ncbi:diphosphate--fructose-6-phosphate 1-phosphotransferase [Ammoniphilus sp. CFH 90114]|uniref:diphosphate--fructose-6-phosphate 1-phosphotransferase n=1 Tax=Ammoniphilus sp. CFH 90114 TaxID=2493665 RepID=UPI00100F97F3|nr:diphosphate--fructose-6-phosphate 1-phosphotransferase [Ammoniphilus sp. CFH 90114]RXT03744.1 diphosphate--fructose-6-phosphate 1-phosphotransferase [Ammoniphilus sp. CFH 90114]